MSIASPPPNRASSTATSSTNSGADQLIDIRITEACRALWWAELTRTALRLVLCAIAALLLWVVFDQWVYSPAAGLRFAIFSVLAAGMVWYVWRRVVPLMGSSIRPEYAARSLERDMPELRQSLTSYVTLRSDRDTAGLRSRVVRSMGAATAGRLRGYDELPAEATGTFRWWVATAIALALLVGYAVVSPKNSFQSAARLAAPFASIDPARRVSIREVEPGDIEAIAGRALVVSAVIDGMRYGEDAYCRWDLPSGRQEVVLQLDADESKHSGELWLPHLVGGEVQYVIAAGDATAGPFRLTVQDVPVVALQSVLHEPPAYTGQQSHTSSSGAITALDGTRVKILATSNRAIVKATIEFNPRELGDLVRATAGATDMEIDAEGTSLSVSFPLRSAHGRSAAVELESYRIKIWDAAGQTNPDPIVYPIRVIADLPPEVSITMPMESPQEVPIDAQQVIEVHASDPDFGLKDLRLEIRSGIDLLAEPILWSDPQGAKGNRVAEYRFRPTEHGLRLGDTVQVVAVAVDNRSIEHNPSIEANVTRTDPIELKITASEPLPQSGDPNSGGLTETDDRPATDHPPKSESSDQPKGQEGQEQSGGGGGGESGESQSGEGQTGEGQSGEGQSGEGQSGEGQSGEGQSGEGQSSDGKSGEGQSGESQSGEGQSSDGKSGEGQSGEGQSSEGQGGEQSTGEQPTGEQQTGQQQTGEGKAGDGQNGEQTGDGQSGQGQTGERQTGERRTGSEEPSGNGQSDRGNAAESSESQSPGGGEAPKHDGETFERIRDYLEQKRKEQQEASGASSDQSTPQPSDQPGGDESGGEQPGGETSEVPRPKDSATTGGSEGQQKSADPSQPRGGENPSDSTSENPSGEAGKKRDPSDSQSGESSTQKDSGDSESGSDSKPGSGDSSQPSQTPNSDSNAKPGERSNSGDSEDGSSGQPVDEGSEAASEGSESEGGEASKGDPSGGESSSRDGQGKGQSGDEQASSDQGESGKNQKEGATGNPPSETQSTADGDPQGDNSQPSTQSQPGTGTGNEGSGEASDAPIPPDPVNVDYAKKATDMVLDYLEENRDAPDQDLLDKLNWTEEDLKRFSERWQNVRDMKPSGETDPDRRNRDVEEALKSLGLRPKTEANDQISESADSLRSIRDSGNRKPPPAAFQDAFDAFRRATSQK